jgi:hypothetical protein
VEEKMNWLMEKLFGKDEPSLGVYIINEKTPEQKAMFEDQKRIMNQLGMEHGNDAQNWLRMHQIMLDHENRIKALEARDAT